MDEKYFYFLMRMGCEIFIVKVFIPDMHNVIFFFFFFSYQICNALNFLVSGIMKEQTSLDWQKWQTAGFRTSSVLGRRIFTKNWNLFWEEWSNCLFSPGLSLFDSLGDLKKLENAHAVLKLDKEMIV